MLKLITYILVGQVYAKDLYQILQVSPDADKQEIKKSFRTLSRKYHPDKNRGDPEANQKYLDVTKAHDILSDPSKRQIYDIYGQEGLTDPSLLNRRKGPNFKFQLQVDLQDVYNGMLRQTSIRRNEICKKCKGTGAKDKKTIPCKACGGKGVRMQKVGSFGFNMQMQVQCDRCSGRGFLAQARCPHCGGKKVVNNVATMKVQIEQGMDNGSQIVFQGESQQSPDWFPGDLIFFVKVKNHPRFQRRGNNLYTKIRLSLKEALIGYQKKISHLDGHVVDIEYTGVTQPGSTRKIPGEGMPHQDVPSNRGALICEFLVDLPGKLTEEQKEQVKRLFSQ